MTLSITSTGQTWTAPDGETFSYSLWRAEGGAPRAVVVAVHGLSGAALDFEPLARHLAPLGVETLAPELRGQGNDPKVNRRGDLARLGDWFTDLEAFLALTQKLHPGRPIFYYGESMGAALLTRYLAQAPAVDQPVGLVLASPVVMIKGKPTAWQQALFRFFLWVRPTHRIDVRKLSRPKDEPPPHVTRDEAHRKWFESASHKLNRFTIRFFKCLHDLIDGCMAAAPRIQVPVLVMYAAHDIFIPPAEVEKFFERLGSADKERRLFPSSYHLLLHDFDKVEVLATLEGWLRPRLSEG